MRITKWWIASAVMGILLIISGILDGELGQILTRAIRICLECVGVG